MKLALFGALLLVLAGLGEARPVNGQTIAPVSDPRFFPQTGFRIDNDAFFNFFQQRGNVRTFGYPVSRTFMLDGLLVQIFQITALTS